MKPDITITIKSTEDGNIKIEFSGSIIIDEYPSRLTDILSSQGINITPNDKDVN